MAAAVSFMDFISHVESFDSLQPLVDRVAAMMGVEIKMIPS